MAQTLIYNTTVEEVTPITLPTFDDDVDNVQQLDDEPNDVGGLTAQELKAVFDKTGADLATFLNDQLIPQVVADDATEQARQLAEGERVSNEQERVSNEGLRVSAETGRSTAEGLRVTAESGRVSAESGRVSAESGRVSAESGRVNAENGRVNAEAGRVSAEESRVLAEQAREDAEIGYIAQAAAQATLAESWAVGGTGARSGEDTNNSKYWCERAAESVAGVASFNGRTGAVMPQAGDYSAADVGARASDWMPTASDVGAMPAAIPDDNSPTDLFKLGVEDGALYIQLVE